MSPHAAPCRLRSLAYPRLVGCDPRLGTTIKSEITTVPTMAAGTSPAGSSSDGVCEQRVEEVWCRMT